VAPTRYPAQILFKLSFVDMKEDRDGCQCAPRLGVADRFSAGHFGIGVTSPGQITGPWPGADIFQVDS